MENYEDHATWKFISTLHNLILMCQFTTNISKTTYTAQFGTAFITLVITAALFHWSPAASTDQKLSKAADLTHEEQFVCEEVGDQCIHEEVIEESKLVSSFHAKFFSCSFVRASHHPISNLVGRVGDELSSLLYSIDYKNLGLHVNYLQIKL